LDEQTTAQDNKHSYKPGLTASNLHGWISYLNHCLALFITCWTLQSFSSHSG